jgi:hypothetical protein
MADLMTATAKYSSLENKYGNFVVPAFKIKSNGSDVIAKNSLTVTDLTVVLSLDSAGMTIIKIADVYDVEKHSFDSKVKKEKGVKYCRFTNSQLWTLCELMETVYSLKEAAEVLGRGGSHYTTNPCADIIQNKAERDRINSEVLPAIFAEIGKLFDEVDKAEKPSKPIRGSGWQQPND